MARLWLWLEQLAVLMPASSPEIALIPFRLASLAGVVLLAIYVPKLAASATASTRTGPCGWRC